MTVELLKESVQEAVQDSLHKMGVPLRDEIIIVAVSGGADSLTLLTVLHELIPFFGYFLHVATFDHGLRGEQGAADVAFVRAYAESLRLSVSVGFKDVRALAESEKLSLETAARQARYTFLTETALEQDAAYIAVGHNRDDQIETVMMHLLRGTGLMGLRGMLPVAPLSESHLLPDADAELFDVLEDIQILRPLLGISRSEINEYAATHQLEPRVDATNQDTSYLRNRLRHDILPLLEDVNPGVRDAVARMSITLQGDYEVIEETVTATMARIVEWGETVPDTDSASDDGGEVAFVDRYEFLKLSQGLQWQLLRRILFDLTPDLRDLPYQQIESACAFIKNARVTQQYSLPADMTLTIGYDEFTVHYGGALPFPRYIPHLRPGQVIPLDIESESRVGDHLRFYSYRVLEGRSKEIRRDDPLEATLVVPEDAILSLRTRRPGDRFSPLGLLGRSQKLSDAFINLKVPRPLRDRVPLLTINDEIAWFVAPTAHGLQGRVSQRFAVAPDSESVLRVRWELLD